MTGPQLSAWAWVISAATFLAAAVVDLIVILRR
jgi:hypothetical protein